jgi:cytochrome c-type biogenesis protein CcmF
MLDTLEEHADSEGRAMPTRGEAWSLRAHGLLERVTPRAILTIAAAALVLAVAVPAAMLSSLSLGSPVLLAMPWAAALLATLALIGLVGRSGVLRAESALAAAVLVVPSWILGGVAAAAWSIGFDEADAGESRSTFSSAFVALALAAWLLGAASLSVVLAGLLGIRSVVGRWIVAVVVALPGALLVGGVALTSGALALALAALIASARPRMRTRTSDGSRAAAGSASAPAARAPLSASGRRAVVITSLVGSALGLACAAFALAGSAWLPAVGDATDAMRAGIAVGSVVALLPVAAGAAGLRPRLGRVVIPAAVSLGAAFLTIAAAFSVPDLDAAAPGYMQVAAGFVGVAGAALLLPVLSGGRVVRGILVVGVAVGIAALAGTMVAVAGAFLAPVLGVVTAVLVARRSRVPRRTQPA